MIKRAPFATIPGQYEIIMDHFETRNRLDKAILDDMTLNALNIGNGYYKEI
jgi:hypothetical protein